MQISGALSPEAELEARNTREERYDLGQFFTPEPIARLMAEAIMEIAPTTVLDPAVGGGVLLRALGPVPRRFGLDIDPSAVEVAADSVGAQGGQVEVALGDCLDRTRWPLATETFDAVIANPPYVRHHYPVGGA